MGLTITNVSIVETYELVNWPDGCHEVPTFYQIASTLDLLELYEEAPDKFSEPLKAKFEAWYKTNSKAKFEKAFYTASEMQDKLEQFEEDFVKTNRMFPLNRSRHDH